MDENEALKQKFYERAARIIHVHRKKKHLSGEAFGGLMGISKSTVTAYEKGRIQIPGHTLYRISRVLEFEFAEYDPDIPSTSEMLCKIAEFKRKRQYSGGGYDFMNNSTSFGFTFVHTPDASGVTFDKAEIEFLDDHFAYADPLIERFIDTLYEMAKEYRYWESLPANLQQLFDSMIKEVFSSDVQSNNEQLDIMYRKYFE